MVQEKLRKRAETEMKDDKAALLRGKQVGNKSENPLEGIKLKKVRRDDGNESSPGGTPSQSRRGTIDAQFVRRGSTFDQSRKGSLVVSLECLPFFHRFPACSSPAVVTSLNNLSIHLS